jgi:hypothetical protein
MNATHRDIKNVKADSAHVFFTKNTFFCCPLEGGDARILDFVEILYTLRDIDKQVRTSSIGTETPDLPGFGNIPSEFIS